jgi:heterodisulfide reductase subunit B
MSLFRCNKCHEVMEELNSLRQDNELIREEMKELLDRIGLRRKTVTEVLIDNLYEENPVWKHFKVKDKSKSGG